MALRDQPYLPLYVQDFMTDEKLAECSASANGVYIRLMCLMHKSEEYGKITLRDKDFCHGKNSGKYNGTLDNFAAKLVKHLPYSEEIIKAGIEELLDEGVLHLEGFSLCQKRMIRDSELSEKRAVSGRRGAITTNAKYGNYDNNSNNKTNENDGDFAVAKYPANSENENENKDIEKGYRGSGAKEKEEPEAVEIENVEDARFTAFQKWISANANQVSKMQDPFTREQFDRIVSEYREEDVMHTLEAMHNYKPLRTKNTSAYLTCRNWLRRDKIATRTIIGPTASTGTSGKAYQTIDAINGALIK